MRGALIATAGHLHPGGLWTDLSLTRTMPTTGTARCRDKIVLNFAIPHVQGFRWYPAIQSTIVDELSGEPLS